MSSTAPITAASADLVAEVEALGGHLNLVRERIGEIIFGQREVIEQALITLLCGGHALLIGVPGLAKTRLVETLYTYNQAKLALARNTGVVETQYKTYLGR